MLFHFLLKLNYNKEISSTPLLSSPMNCYFFDNKGGGKQFTMIILGDRGFFVPLPLDSPYITMVKI